MFVWLKEYEAGLQVSSVRAEDEAELIRSGLRNDHDKSWAQPRFEAFDISTIKVFR